MQTEGIAERGVVVAAGYGLKLYVERGHLVVHDGVGSRRRTLRFNRATGKLKRLIVLGHDGYVTLEALHWLRETGAAFVQLDHHGQPVALSAPTGADLAPLRRAQALAATSEAGVAVARLVLGEKLRGQRAVMRELPTTARGDEQLDQALADLDTATDVPGLLAAEFAASSAYWGARSSVPLPFPAARTGRLPEHWLTFGQRHSVLTHTNRIATNPASAVLNYLYALLEAETTLALQAVGLDPGIGVFHADKPGRASLALDVMEACRPVIDAYLLAWLTQRTLDPRDFIETPRGACRLRPAMCKQLAATSLIWASHTAPIVEQVAQILGEPAGVRIATRLTESNRKTARAARPGMPRSRPAAPTLPSVCGDCGARVPNRRHRYCEVCRTRRWTAKAPAGRATAGDVLLQLRAEGRDPAHGGDAARRRGEKNAAHQRAVLAWNERDDDGVDRRVFVEEIQPRLGRATIGELVDATGLSAHYCSLIRLGKRVPHPRHWAALDARGS